MSAPKSNAAQLRAASGLVVKATTEVTTIVQQMHDELGLSLAKPLTRLVYASIRGVTKAVGFTLDRSLQQLEPHLGQSVSGAQRLALTAVLNGVVGDYLEAQQSPLAQRMEFCREGETLDVATLKQPSARLLVLVHGSSMNDLQWLRNGHEHGAALERDGGFTAVHLRYNSGLHVSTNGRQLAALLESLVASWPVPVRDVTLLCHSMGGLVARSAVHFADQQTLRWRSRLTAMVFLGTPHHGAPLERAGNWVDTLLQLTAASAPLAKLGKIRSAGVTDLRFGNVRDEDWRGRERFALGKDPRAPLPLPKRVKCFAVAASLSKQAVAKPRSDGLVPVDSALGKSHEPARDLGFPARRQRVLYGLGHLDLLNDVAVYEALKTWLC